MIAHGIMLLLCLISWSPYLLLINIPMTIWHARKYVTSSLVQYLQWFGFINGNHIVGTRVDFPKESCSWTRLKY